MHTEAASLTRPPITLIDNEAESLYDLALAARGKSKQAAELLLQEVDRADTFAREDLPADVVTMMSSVVFVDESTGEEHKVQLVWPKDADSANDRISVLTPISERCSKEKEVSSCPITYSSSGFSGARNQVRTFSKGMTSASKLTKWEPARYRVPETLVFATAMTRL